MGDILIFAGGLLLLASWLTQNFQFDKWNGRLDEIRDARSNFATYQANNALMGALGLLVPAAERERQWDLQKKNYQTGLNHLREAMSESRRAGLGQRIDAATDKYHYMGEYARGQAEVVVIQQELLKERETIADRHRRAQRQLWVTYAAGSLAVVVGNIL
jgi:hypothetical protein